MTVEKSKNWQTIPLASVAGEISIKLIDDLANQPYYGKLPLLFLCAGRLRRKYLHCLFKQHFTHYSKVVCVYGIIFVAV